MTAVLNLAVPGRVRDGLTETLEHNLAHPATSSEFDLHQAVNTVLADVGGRHADIG